MRTDCASNPPPRSSACYCSPALELAAKQPRATVTTVRSRIAAMTANLCKRSPDATLAEHHAACRHDLPSRDHCLYCRTLSLQYNSPIKIG